MDLLRRMFTINIPYSLHNLLQPQGGANDAGIKVISAGNAVIKIQPKAGQN